MIKNIKYIFQSIIIIVIFSYVFRYLDVLFNPRFIIDEPREAFYLLEKQKNTVFILGNSHVQCSFIPRIFEELIDQEKFINLTISGGSTSDLYFYLKAILEADYIPSIVILETYPFRSDNFNYINNLFLYDYNFFEYIFSNILKISLPDIVKYSSSLVGESKYSKNNILTYAQYNWTYFNSNDYLNNRHILTKGYHESQEIMDLEKYNYAIELKELKKIKQDTIKYLYLIKEICDEYDITLISTRSPNLDTLRYEDLETKDLMELLDIPFIDLNINVLNEIDSPYLMFRDVYYHPKLEHEFVNSHLNDYGALYSTLKLTKELQNLEYFEINQEIYDQYWSELQDALNSIELK